MKLARLRLRNFRCYKNEIAFDFNDMTAFVGKNDVGKSSVMDALDIFLNENAPDRNDASKNGDGKDLTIICEFEDLPDEAIIDEDFPTTFKAEYLLNADGRLEIHKTFSGNTATPKCINIAAWATHPSAKDAIDLLRLKNSDLKKRAKDIGVDLKNVDQKVNAQLRQRIRESVGDLKPTSQLIPLNDENAKKAWEGIKAYIPIFALFKSDRQITDQDPEAQDPLKIAVKEALKQKEVELTAITAHVEEEVKKIAKKTLAKLKEMDPTLAQELNPQFTPPKWDSLFKASITGDEDIPINKRGSGVKRLILLNFFRAKAEQMSIARQNVDLIFGIEEPETSQHPHNQKLLINALVNLASNNQVIITTHTPMLARILPDECLRFINEKPDKTREILNGGEATNSLFAKSLGVLPDNTVKLFIGVEGANDIAFLKNISKVLRKDGVEILDLEKMELDGEVIFFPLGGSSLALWTSRLANLLRPEFYLFDRDNVPPLDPKYKGKADEINTRSKCKAIHTGKREMENYLQFDAIKEAYESNGITVGISTNFSAFDDVPQKVAELVHIASGSQKGWSQLGEKLREKKISQAKFNLNNNAVQLMTKARLALIDPDGNVIDWFVQMKNLIAP